MCIRDRDFDAAFQDILRFIQNNICLPAAEQLPKNLLEIITDQAELLRELAAHHSVQI